MRFRLAIRTIVALLAVLLLAAAAGWLPLAPVLVVAVVGALVLAAEALIALRAQPRRPAPPPERREALIDSSALIDGRLQDVAATGFLDLDLVVPQFVLRELQHVADAAEPLRRARGRRGLDMVQAMRASSRSPVRVIEEDVPDERAVDLKLVALARRRGSALVTTDYALNKLAGIHDIAVLNVNELAHALRPVLLPGDRLRVTIVKDGKEPGQGIAYLEDGTMVVVEQGRGLTGRSIEVVVTSAIQTAAGKMFFARPTE